MAEQKTKKAIFLDNKSNIQYSIIYEVPGVALIIDTFDLNDNKTGYMKLYFNPNNRIYLDVIYCYDAFRNNGIATKMSELADYLLKEQTNAIIRGVLQPSNLSTDRENNLPFIQEELDLKTRNFYTSNGYSIISYEDYLTNPNKYPGIDVVNDFQLGEAIFQNIVVKMVEPKEKYSFQEINGILIHDNALGLKIDENIGKKIR